MKLLISVESLAEARAAVPLDIDILDVKNPREGSLGAARPKVVRAIAAVARAHAIPLSVALGDLPCEPGTAAMAAFGAAHCNVQFIKAGFRGITSVSAVRDRLRAIGSAVRDAGGTAEVVAAGYGDFQRVEALRPDQLLDAAAGECHGVLFDTAVKDGRSLLDWLDADTLRSLVDAAHQRGLFIGLAGSLSLADFPALRAVEPDIVGVRGAACVGGSRSNRVSPTRVRRIRAALTRSDDRQVAAIVAQRRE